MALIEVAFCRIYTQKSHTMVELSEGDLMLRYFLLGVGCFMFSMTGETMARPYRVTFRDWTPQCWWVSWAYPGPRYCPGDRVICGGTMACWGFEGVLREQGINCICLWQIPGR